MTKKRSVCYWLYSLRPWVFVSANRARLFRSRSFLSQYKLLLVTEPSRDPFNSSIFFVCHNKKKKRNIMLLNAVDNDPYSWWLRTWEKLNLTMWSLNLWRDIYYPWVLLFYDRFVCRQFRIAILLFGQHQMIWLFFLLQTDRKSVV